MDTKPGTDRVMMGVIPYFSIKEGAEKAIEFYKKAFGAIQHGESAKDENGNVMNATVEINGGAIMLMDDWPEMGTEPARGVTMQLVIQDGDMWWKRAVEAGCTVTQEFGLAFWGDRYGSVVDPFGIAWAFDEPGPANRGT